MAKDHSDSERGNPLPPHGLWCIHDWAVATLFSLTFRHCVYCCIYSPVDCLLKSTCYVCNLSVIVSLEDMVTSPLLMT